MSRAVFIAVSLLLMLGSRADEVPSVGDAQQIVVIRNGEGIHYAHGCAFYELRDLLSEGVDGVSRDVSTPDTPLFEVRLVGKSGVSTVYVGDHWISTEGRVAVLASATYDQILKLVAKRKGGGVPESRIEESVQVALTKIKRPTYVEENRCPHR
jgi:hypothetical protein